MFLLDNDNLAKAYKLIISRLDEHLSAKGYEKIFVDTLDNNEDVTVFKGEDVAYSVIYNEDIKQFQLNSCAVDNTGEIDENWARISSWLYDTNTDSIKEAQSIAEDFVDTLGGAKRLAAVTQIKKKKKKGEETNVNALFMMNRLVNIWPDLKAEIKFEKENYETFRGITFAREKVLHRFKELINGTDNNRKKKLCTLLNDEYKVGDLDVRSIITIVLLNSIDDHANIEEVESYLSHELRKAWKYSRKLKGKNIKPEKPKKNKKGFMAKTLAESQNR